MFWILHYTRYNVRKCATRHQLVLKTILWPSRGLSARYSCATEVTSIRWASMIKRVSRRIWTQRWFGQGAPITDHIAAVAQQCGSGVNSGLGGPLGSRDLASAHRRAGSRPGVLMGL